MGVSADTFDRHVAPSIACVSIGSKRTYTVETLHAWQAQHTTHPPVLLVPHARSAPYSFSPRQVPVTLLRASDPEYQRRLAQRNYDRTVERVEEKRTLRREAIDRAEARMAKRPEQLAHEEVGSLGRWQGDAFKPFPEEELAAHFRDDRQRERLAAEIHKLRDRDRRLRKGERTRLRHLKEKLDARE